ncbi:hypothetical protein L6269_04685, partial [Candidatus Dependentiae bacterium]|nr:hypothetical protein [Candidatus Dependentiae bacterium]
LNEISIDKIIKENSDVDIEVYELSLEEPHCYFVCDSAENPILIHNMDQIFMTAGDKAESILETVVSTGVTLFGLAKSLGLFDKKKKQEDKKQLPKVAENNKSENKATDKTKKTDDKKQSEKGKDKGNDSKNDKKNNKTPESPKKSEKEKSSDVKTQQNSKQEKTKEKSCKVVSGTSQAPERAEPNSVYYKLDNSNKRTIVSKTVYNENGQPKFREDYDHSHFDRKTGQDLKNGHRHIFEYNQNGQIIKPIKVVPLN